MLNPHLHLAVEETRRSDRLKEARLAHLRNQLRVHNYGLSDRLLMGAGDSLIALGRALKRQCPAARNQVTGPVLRAG